MLLEAWLGFEEKHQGDIKRVEDLMPRKIKRRRQITTENGIDAGWEEYFDYIFPSDQADKGATKLLAAAQKWKKQIEEEETAKNQDSDTDMASSSSDSESESSYDSSNSSSSSDI